MERFTPLDHPADLGLIAYGQNYQEVFINAAFGMFSLMADLTKVIPQQSFNLRVTATKLDELLVNWLNELIYLEDAKKIVLCQFIINKINEHELEALVLGEKIDPIKHAFARPIKAATYNQLQIGPNQARVVFDV